MSDQNYRPCIVCNDEGLYFCRVCSSSYCFEHLCLHLSVAQESNSWTNRNNSEEPHEPEAPAVGNEKALTSYTEEQLKSALNFYTSQSRAVRRELERRSLPISGAFTLEDERFNSPRNSYKRKLNPGKPKLSKRAVEAQKVLIDALRANHISLEQMAVFLQQQESTKSSDSVPF